MACGQCGNDHPPNITCSHPHDAHESRTPEQQADAAKVAALPKANPRRRRADRQTKTKAA